MWVCNFPCAVLQFMLLGKIMSCFIVRVFFVLAAMILPMNVDHFEVAPRRLLLLAIIKFKFVPQNSPIIH